jgi:hypothetical protein
LFGVAKINIGLRKAAKELFLSGRKLKKGKENKEC